MRESFLRLFGLDPKVWAKKYGIEPFETPCLECGKLFKTEIPIANQKFVGLISPPCPCGNTDTPFCFVGKDTDLLNIKGLNNETK